QLRHASPPFGLLGFEVALDLLGVLTQEQAGLRLFVEAVLGAHAPPWGDEDPHQDDDRDERAAHDPRDPVGGEHRRQGEHSTFRSARTRWTSDDETVAAEGFEPSLTGS